MAGTIRHYPDENRSLLHPFSVSLFSTIRTCMPLSGYIQIKRAARDSSSLSVTRPRMASNALSLYSIINETLGQHLIFLEQPAT